MLGKICITVQTTGYILYPDLLLASVAYRHSPIQLLSMTQCDIEKLWNRIIFITRFFLKSIKTIRNQNIFFQRINNNNNHNSIVEYIQHTSIFNITVLT